MIPGPSARVPIGSADTALGLGDTTDVSPSGPVLDLAGLRTSENTWGADHSAPQVRRFPALRERTCPYFAIKLQDLC
jgi:hypothetical protein